MKDLYWKYFTETGNIELYLEYKKRCRENEPRGGEKINGHGENKGADSQDGQQRR